MYEDPTSFTSAPLPKLYRPPASCPDAPALPQELIPAAKLKVENDHYIEEPSFRDQRDDPNKELPRGNILHISNICSKLSYEQIKQGLYKLFSVHGPIYEIIVKTKESGQHFAFVDFPDIRDAEKALLASKKERKFLSNKELQVNYCEDPKKNEARKDQKCYLCLGTGHKAAKCPVKPEMIKPKAKKSEHGGQDETCDLESVRNFKDTARSFSQSVEDLEQDSEVEQIRKRDKDYLRFLKLKKKLLEQKLRKRIKKSKKKKH